MVWDKMMWVQERIKATDVMALLSPLTWAQRWSKQHLHDKRWAIDGHGLGRFSLAAYRVVYHVDLTNRVVHISDVVSGFRERVLRDPRELLTDPEVQQHRAFIDRFSQNQEFARRPESCERN